MSYLEAPELNSSLRGTSDLSTNKESRCFRLAGARRGYKKACSDLPRSLKITRPTFELVFHNQRRPYTEA